METQETRIFSQARVYDEGLRSFLIMVLGAMCVGLFATAGLTLFLNRFCMPLLMTIFSSNLYWLLIAGLFATSFATVSMVRKIQSGELVSYKMSLGVYAAYVGLISFLIAPIHSRYDSGSILSAFLMSASFFGGMCIFGYTTKKDLTQLRSLLTFSAIALIFLSIVQMALGMKGFEILLSSLFIAFFTASTAVEFKNLKNIYSYSRHYPARQQNQLLMFFVFLSACILFSNFIQIFLHLLTIMGRRRND